MDLERAEERIQWKFWMSDYEAVLGIMIVLVAIGSLNVFSSSFVVADTNYDDPYFFLRKQGLNVLVGLVCFGVGALADYHWWGRARKYIGWAVGALLLAVLLVGVEVNGARRWLSLGPVQMQPAEFAKLAAIFLEANYIAGRVKLGKHCLLLHRELLAIFALGGLVEREPDMGTASIICGIPILMMLCSNMKVAAKLLIVFGGIFGGAVLCIAQPYRLARITALMNPWADAQGAGYQSVQSLQAIGSGGLFGMGLGMGISKYHYLPEAHTDFAFAVWCQETGYIGAFCVLLMFAALAYYGARIANGAKDAMGQMLALGFTLLLSVQAVINFLMIAGCFPVVGVPLPFISYGGSSLFVSLFAIGVLVNIGYRSGRRRAAATSAPPPDEALFGRPRNRRIK